MIAVFDTNIVIDSLNGVLEADAEGRRHRFPYFQREWRESANDANSFWFP